MNKVPPTELALIDAIHEYLNVRRFERGSSEESIYAYRATLYKLDWDYPKARLAEFEGKPGTELLRMSIRRHWGEASKSTRNTRTSYIRSFFKWCRANDLMETNPAEVIERSPSKKRVRRRPTPEEMDSIYQAAESWERPALVLMCWLGLRVSEVVNARWRHVDWVNRRLYVPYRKGDKPTEQPLYSPPFEMLHGLYNELRPGSDDCVFTARDWTGESLPADIPRSRNAVNNMVRRLCVKAEVGPFFDEQGREYLFSPHSFRHGTATRLYKTGLVPKDAIQMLLAHESPSTTQGYLDALEIGTLEKTLNAALSGPSRREMPAAVAGSSPAVPSVGPENSVEAT